jgi:sterol desaturase/sphingolipid hydroxylase (fatty acid hydroxylase superfamily)
VKMPNPAPSSPATPLWRKSHHLERMTFRELVVAYFQYRGIQVDLVLAALMVPLWLAYPASLPATAASIVLVVLAYPLLWYALHRWLLHSRWMFKVPLLAPAWKRIHYDHHMDPDHLEVLFGALYTTLPTLLLAAALPGWLIGGPGGAAAGFATGLLVTCFYEFCHCIQHLSYKPRRKFLAVMKARHMEHHFHDEDGNFGITNFMWDRVFGTLYRRPDRPAKSPTVFNLGYTAEIAVRYPTVRRLSGNRPLAGGRRSTGLTAVKASGRAIDQMRE